MVGIVKEMGRLLKPSLFMVSLGWEEAVLLCEQSRKSCAESAE